LFVDKNKNCLLLSEQIDENTRDILASILSKYEKNLLIDDKTFFSVINILAYSTFNLEKLFDFNYDELMVEVKQLIYLSENNLNNQENICGYYHTFFNKKNLIVGSTLILSGLLISLGLPSKIGSILIKTAIKSEEL
jgi:hypothetical protein